MLLLIVTAGAVACGMALPLRWGLLGFLGAAALLFLVHFGALVARGFEGASLEESLLLFNGSYATYLGFNAQITYRAFAVPLLALAAPIIFRATRR